MKTLDQQEWKLKYTPDSGDLVEIFYVPALQCAVHYDRTTGYFSANVLSLAMRGVEELIRNHGRMRLVVGCTLGDAEVEAVKKGEDLRRVVEKELEGRLREAVDPPTHDALELLSWMVQHGYLEMKVAVPCDLNRQPVNSDAIFHEKAGIITDDFGNRLAFNGSVNETAHGWIHNWESFNVFTSWADQGRVDQEQRDFATIWTGNSNRLITLDVPEAVRQDLLRYLPENDKPARVEEKPPEQPKPDETEPPGIAPDELRKLVWAFIARAATMPNGGERVGEATSAVEPWPHQVRAFERMYAQDHPRLLIADEVGLGKTIQAGMLLRQLWLAGRMKRCLILAPAAVLRQWQLELHDKFNLNWPVYDGGKLNWYPTPGQPAVSRVVSKQEWHQEPFVIASSHLMRRGDRQSDILEHSEPWDLVIVDEAHHARRRGVGGSGERPNALLTLLRRLPERTKGLLLLTATPMQVDPVEVWDLLSVLGLPEAWSAPDFLRFFEIIEQGNPGNPEFEMLAKLFRASEAAFGEATDADLHRFGIKGLKAGKTLKALRDPSSIPRKQLESTQRKAAVQLMKQWSPVGKLISRNTRALLREYFKQGKITTPIADRAVEDRFIDLSPDERAVYEAVEDYISTTYQAASANKKTAIGFVMTVYRRRVASSFAALRNTLKKRLHPLTGQLAQLKFQIDEDASDDESRDEVMDADEVAKLEKEVKEERSSIEQLLEMIRPLRRDTKLQKLLEAISELRESGHDRIMIFTQYTDTMDFVRTELVKDGVSKLVCLSGRGAEALEGAETWRVISRDELKRRFREGSAEILLCTDAASEGLNLQFCGALVNYDMPWNPMRVEQRIGRIDRVGQKHKIIRIINLHYRGTVEADVYAALRTRIGLFESVVGRLQPILAKLPGRISNVVLVDPRVQRENAKDSALRSIDEEIENARRAGFDLDEFIAADLELSPRPKPLLDLDILDRVLRNPSLLPPGIEVRQLAAREYGYLLPGMHAEMRVTTDPAFFEENSDSVELWSAGSRVFPSADSAGQEVIDEDGLHGIQKLLGIGSN